MQKVKNLNNLTLESRFAFVKQTAFSPARHKQCCYEATTQKFKVQSPKSKVIFRNNLKFYVNLAYILLGW